MEKYRSTLTLKKKITTKKVEIESMNFFYNHIHKLNVEVCNSNGSDLF